MIVWSEVFHRFGLPSSVTLTTTDTKTTPVVQKRSVQCYPAVLNFWKICLCVPQASWFCSWCFSGNTNGLTVSGDQDPKLSMRSFRLNFSRVPSAKCQLRRMVAATTWRARPAVITSAGSVWMTGTNTARTGTTARAFKKTRVPPNRSMWDHSNLFFFT